MAICFWPTFQSLVAIPSSSPPAQIVRDSQWTIVVADAVYSNGTVALPIGAEIGDVVEIYSNYVNYNHESAVVASSGESLFNVTGTPCFCRKISSSVWSGI